MKEVKEENRDLRKTMKEYKKKTNEGVSQDQYMGSKQVGRSGDTQYKYQNQNRRRIQQFTGEKDQE